MPTSSAPCQATSGKPRIRRRGQPRRARVSRHPGRGRLGCGHRVEPKFVSPSDPAAQWTGACGSRLLCLCDNYLIDLKHAVIVDVEASRAVRQAEVGAARTMLERTAERFGLKPQRLAADSAYGSAEMLHWLVEEQKIEPHVPVIDKSERQDGTFSRSDFSYDPEADTTPVRRARGWCSTGAVRSPAHRDHE